MTQLYKFVINGKDIYVSAWSAESAAEKINKHYWPVIEVTEKDAVFCPNFLT